MEKTDVPVEFAPYGVSDSFISEQGMPFEYITAGFAKEILLPRSDLANKHTYGHTLLVCGSLGMAGAAVLAAGGALRSGCGLVTVHIPFEERFALTANYPSAMTSLDPAHYFTKVPDNIRKYSSVGVGCGLGQSAETASALSDLIDVCRSEGIPMIIDADAINILADRKDLLSKLPSKTILTPHAGELERLIGEWSSNEDKILKTLEFAGKYDLVVISKGHDTMVCEGSSRILFNSTGNSGMAKGGSGDILTGFLAGLIARGYGTLEAATLGVFIHGLAGDKARDYFGPEGMNSADIIDFLAEAMIEIE